MSLLSVVRRAALLAGQPQPTTVAASPDRTALLMAELARVDAEDLSGRFDWPGLLRDRAFTTVAAVDQPDALPDDFGRMAAATDDRGQIYDVARREGIAGPASADQWRVMLDGFVGWTTAWRVFGGALQLAPAPPAGRAMRFAYVTRNLYLAGSTPKPAWEADTDTCRIPEDLIALGVLWRWKQGRGFEYAEDLANAERAIERAVGQAAGGRRQLVMGRTRWGAPLADGAVVPAYPGTLGP